MAALTLAANAQSIERAAALLHAGEVVAYPTETLYGLGASARPASLARLLAVKGRPEQQAISLLVADLSMLRELIHHLPSAAERLIARYWPGPLTLVLPAAEGLPPQLIGPGGGVGVRQSSDPVASALVQAAGEPITATSANRSGEPPATRAPQAAALDGIALCLDDGDRSAPPSTVVEILDGPPRVLRVGAIPLDGIFGNP